MTPSKQQQSIIDWVISGSGNLLIQAYAGCGKSSTLLMLLPYMQGDVFIGAFNAAIKQELEAKVNKLQLDCNVDVKTIHGAGLGAYKYGGGSRTTKPDKDKVYYILDELAAHDDVYATYRNFLAKLVGHAKRAGVGPLIPDTDASWEELISYYSVDDEIPDGSGYGEGDDEDESEILIANLISYARNVYQTSFSQCRDIIDFDDMLIGPIHFNCRFKKYDWVLVDECQDSSPIRQEITVRMLKKGGRMVCVGDFFQMIFGFTGVAHTSMDEIKERMNMATMPLSVTYRCPKSVVAVANQWVPGLEAHPSAPDGTVRTVWLEPPTCIYCGGTGRQAPPTTEDGICTPCSGKGKTGPGFWDEAAGLGPESAILCRNNRPIIDLAYQMLRKGIPCQIEGRDFAGSLVKLCQRWKVKELNTLETKLQGFRDKEAAKWRRKKNEERAAGVEDKVDTLLSLLDAVRSTGKTRTSDLIDRINMMFGDTAAGAKPKVLTLSSIHKAKGKEWDKVYMLGRAKFMPSRWAKQPHEIQTESVNLPYVMATRSKSDLIDIIVPEGNRRREP